MLAHKKALLLDMNSTFMFGEDRFGDSEDFSRYYSSIGGSLPANDVNGIIRAAYAFLAIRYPDERYRHSFPSVEAAIRAVAPGKWVAKEVEKIVDTFAYHERGQIPSEYAEALHGLAKRFALAVVIDIWAPKKRWLEIFQSSGIANLFAAMSFSSDHGMVKPSPRPFELVLAELGIAKERAVVVGDSVRRDLGGARNAGIDCILVGGAAHPGALASVGSLLDLLAFA